MYLEDMLCLRRNLKSCPIPYIWDSYFRTVFLSKSPFTLLYLLTLNLDIHCDSSSFHANPKVEFDASQTCLLPVSAVNNSETMLITFPPNSNGNLSVLSCRSYT